MDVLSSQSTVSGYKGVLIGAAALGKFLPMLTTAAGNISPAKVFVIGAGVAGLQAIATARRLGGVVSAFDVRPAAREQVLSLGATFVANELVSRRREAAGGYARAQTQDEQDEHARRDRQAHQGSGSRRHHGADSRAPGADADHRRDGRVDARRLGDRRSGRRDGRQLRALEAGRDGAACTTSRSSRRSTCRRPWRFTPARCSAATSSSCSSIS